MTVDEFVKLCLAAERHDKKVKIGCMDCPAELICYSIANSVDMCDIPGMLRACGVEVPDAP